MVLEAARRVQIVARVHAIRSDQVVRVPLRIHYARGYPSQMVVLSGAAHTNGTPEHLSQVILGLPQVGLRVHLVEARKRETLLLLKTACTVSVVLLVRQVVPRRKGQLHIRLIFNLLQALHSLVLPEDRSEVSLRM